MADNLQKKPSKGILKNSSSFDKQEQTTNSFVRRKSKETKWDEMNIIATLHPADKDYGHMKIDEPKTPYNYEYMGENVDELDAVDLAEKIRLGSEKLPKAMQIYDDDDDEDEDDKMLTPEERAKKKEFESKRKKHYNEFYAVKLARKLLEEEDEDDDEQQEHISEMETKSVSGSSTKPPSTSSNNSPNKKQTKQSIQSPKE
ncbi:hypothetical protein FQA39_LY18062 [Lamprigera yunnana]|nr:hypothetical protein FQA39_LY18062 [Lamprigera yunnana]